MKSNDRMEVNYIYDQIKKLQGISDEKKEVKEKKEVSVVKKFTRKYLTYFLLVVVLIVNILIIKPIKKYLEKTD